MKKKESLELSINFIKALSWPLIVLVFLIGFWSPIEGIINSVSSVINRSETITIAGLSLNIEKGVGIKPREVVKDVLSKISPNGLEKLMSTKNKGFYFTESSKIDFEELFELKLVKEVPKSELGEKYKFGVEPTLLGVRTQKFLDAIMVGLVKQLSK